MKVTKKSEINLAVLQNFILHITHSSDDEKDENFAKPIVFTAEELYQMALDYIQEDHVDGEENPEDHIVTYSVESSYEFEDKDKEFPENIVIFADYGPKIGTQTISTLSGAENLDKIKGLFVIMDDPYSSR